LERSRYPTTISFWNRGVSRGSIKASNEVNAETSASNPDFKKILESQTEFRNDGNLWWQVAEYSYETFMIRTRSKG
jgi:TRAP-type mannitol/chloroaromatic compound transport system substrate-binding protein